MKEKNKGFRGISVIAMALVAVLVTVPAATSYAEENRIASKYDIASGSNSSKKEDDFYSGVGQLQVSIHGMKGIAKNKEKVTLIIAGEEYVATLKGETLTFSMETEDNGFDFEPDESMDIEFISSKGSGIITIRHQEGNGDDIVDEDDQGLNNYCGAYRFDPDESESETSEETEESSEEETSAEETEESTEETSVEETSEEESSTEETSEEETEESTEETSEEETLEFETEETLETEEPTEEPSEEESTGEATKPETEESTEGSNETNPDEEEETDSPEESKEEPEVIVPTVPDNGNSGGHGNNGGHGSSGSGHGSSKNSEPAFMPMEMIPEMAGPVMIVELDIPKSEMPVMAIPKTGEIPFPAELPLMISTLGLIMIMSGELWKQKLKKIAESVVV